MNADEHRRTNPDIAVYVPKGEEHHDGDNEHLLVFETPGGDLLAMWTQSSVEERGDNRVVLARSKDGVAWSEPEIIAGTHPGTAEPQASWGFPIVSAQGRIYCLYLKETDVVDTSRSKSGEMGCHYSDDDGRTWIQGKDVPMTYRNRFDNPDSSVPRNWIVWQGPIRDSQGRWLVGYSQYTSLSLYWYDPAGWWEWEIRCQFMRFDNIDEGPAPEDISISWLPLDGEGIAVPYLVKPDVSRASEPSIVLLPDGRILTTIQSFTGYIWYSVSEDDGEHWREPDVLRYSDSGRKIKHPIAPCPVYALQDGRYVLLFHNNNGRLGSHDQFAKKWTTNHANFIRRPVFIAAGEFRPEAHQPIWFSEPKRLYDTDGVCIGPKHTAELSLYGSFTEFRGERTLWYSDRKHYMLGKYITDELLADMTVEQVGTPAQADSGPHTPAHSKQGSPNMDVVEEVVVDIDDLIEPERHDILEGVEHLRLLDMGFPETLTLFHLTEMIGNEPGLLKRVAKSIKENGYQKQGWIQIVDTSTLRTDRYRHGRAEIKKKYVLFDGRKRLAALKYLGHDTVNACVVDRPYYVPPDYTTWIRDVYVVDFLRGLLTAKKKLFLAGLACKPGHCPEKPGPYQPIPFDDFSDIGYRSEDTVQRFEQMVKYIKPSPSGKRILDLGSNLGYFCFSLNKMGASCVGVEIMPANYYVALKLSQHYHMDSTFVWSPITPSAVDRIEGHFDATLILNAIHNIMTDSLDLADGPHESGVEYCVEILKKVHEKSDMLILNMITRPTGYPIWDDNPKLPHMGNTFDEQVQWIERNLIIPSGYIVESIVASRRPIFICRRKKRS